MPNLIPPVYLISQNPRKIGIHCKAVPENITVLGQDLASLQNTLVLPVYRGGSKICFRRGAPIRNGVTDW